MKKLLFTLAVLAPLFSFAEVMIYSYYKTRTSTSVYKLTYNANDETCLAENFTEGLVSSFKSQEDVAIEKCLLFITAKEDEANGECDEKSTLLKNRNTRITERQTTLKQTKTCQCLKISTYTSRTTTSREEYLLDRDVCSKLL